MDRTGASFQVEHRASARTLGSALAFSSTSAAPTWPPKPEGVGEMPEQREKNNRNAGEAGIKNEDIMAMGLCKPRMMVWINLEHG